MLVLFCSSFLSLQVWFHLAEEERELGALVCSEFRVASVL